MGEAEITLSERGAAQKPIHALFRHAVAHRVAVIDFDSEDGAGAVEVPVRYVAEDVLRANAELLDREVGSIVDGGKNAAALDEFAQVPDAFESDSAGVFIGFGTGKAAGRPATRATEGEHGLTGREPRIASNDGIGVFVRNDDDVMARVQVARANILVQKRRVRELVIFENKARPAFIHAGYVAAVNADAGLRQRNGVGDRPISGNEVDPQVGVGMNIRATNNESAGGGIPGRLR